WVPPVSTCERTQVFGELLLGTLARRPRINSIWPRSLVCVSKLTLPHKGNQESREEPLGRPASLSTHSLRLTLATSSITVPFFFSTFFPAFFYSPNTID